VEVASQLLAQLVRVSPDLVSQVLPMALPWVEIAAAPDRHEASPMLQN
jgi:hypothetical protein